MNYMKDILNEMKDRPGMWIGEHNLKNLNAFINGYMYRIFQDDDFMSEFYTGFQEHIEAIYNVNTGHHWTKILDFYSDSEEAALKKFFFHLQEYTKIDENNLKSK